KKKKFEGANNKKKKVKGTGSIGNYSNWQKAIPYDSTDLIYPPAEQDALFVTTALLTTPNQTVRVCPGSKDIVKLFGKCTTNSDCPSNVYTADSYGITTGVCGSNKYCEIYGWCPLENSSAPLGIVNNVGNFTVFVKVNVRFAAFGVSRSNLEDRDHNGAPILGYNLFEVNDMLSRATGGKMKNVKLLAKKGAIIAVTSTWNCNLDNGADKCNPTFQFQRLDNSTNSVSLGNPTGTNRRLRKLIGVRFVFVVDGKAGKFSFAALSVTFGAGLAYIGIASFITDIVLERFLPESSKYSKAKNEKISSLTMALSTDRIFEDVDLDTDGEKGEPQTNPTTTNEQPQEPNGTATPQPVAVAQIPVETLNKNQSVELTTSAQLNYMRGDKS
ncbi:P2X receptor subunit, partial [Reticulomyxa filosa]